MSQGFEFFDGSAAQNKDPRITVRRGGQLILTPAAVQMLGDGVTHVQLGFNAETGAVGLRPAAEDSSRKYSLRKQKNSSSRLVDGKRFFTYHKMTPDEPHTFDAEDLGNGIVGFYLATNDAQEAGDRDTDKKTRGRRKSRATS